MHQTYTNEGYGTSDDLSSFSAISTNSEQVKNNGSIDLDQEIQPVPCENGQTPSEVKRKWVMVATKATEEGRSEHVPLERRDPQRNKKRVLQRQENIPVDNDEHVVFKPVIKGDCETPGTQFATLINNIVAQNRQKKHDQQRKTLLERQLQFNLHLNATKEVLKEQTEELINKPDEFEPETNNFRNITLKLMNLKKPSTNPENSSLQATTPSNLLMISSAQKWKQKAAKMHSKKNLTTSHIESSL